MEPADEHAAAARGPDINVPRGYRFKPTPEELIQFYLDPWLDAAPGGEPSPGERHGIMCATDVYAVPPAALTARFQHLGHDDGNWYFLSVARWRDGGRDRKAREVGPGTSKLGTWHGSGKRIDVPGLGSRLTFEYRHGPGRVKVKTEWLMEEYTSARTVEAATDAGVKVLCRLHLTPKAAAEGEGGGGEGQQPPPPPPQTKGKRQRAAPRAAECGKRKRAVVAPQVRHGADADYWTAAPAPPDVGCSYTYYASTSSSSSQHPAAPPPALPEAGYSYYAATSSSSQHPAAPPAALPEAGYSYYAAASSSSHHPAAPPAALPEAGCSYYATTSSSSQTLEELQADCWEQQPPMMEPGGVEVEGYHCAGGVHGGVYLQDEPPPLEMIPEGMEWVQHYSQSQLMEMECGMYFTPEDFGMAGDCSTFLLSYPEASDGVQENDDLKPAEAGDGVQENNDDLRTELGYGVQENNGDLRPELGDGVQENDDDLKPEPSDGVQGNDDASDGVQENDDPKSGTDAG